MKAKRERKKLWLAVVASLFLHLVIALSLAAFSRSSVPIAPEEDEPVQLTMVDLSATPPPRAPINPPYVENDPSRESAEQPKEKTFESNANSIAASQLPATGDAPVPTQQGKERPSMDFQTQNYSVPVEGSQSRPQPT
ncbi:MAG TPA: hypothetical protein VF551_04680, partial [Chthoniobacterales bacterium]